MNFVIAWLACTPTDGVGFGTDDELAADLFAAIDGYESWGQKEGWTSTPVASASHGGDFVTAYYDDALMAWDGTTDAPEGAVSVKAQFDSAEATNLLALTVMQKVAGYDAEHNDWFWARYAPDGTSSINGKVEVCWGCHVGAEATDWVFGAPPT